MEKKLEREQHKSSKTCLACKVARLHEKLMNQRNDFLNKLSTEIIKIMVRSV